MSLETQTIQEEKPDFKKYFYPGKDENGKPTKPAFKKGIFEIAKYITEKYNCLSFGEFKRDVFVYDNGVYRLGTNLIKEHILYLLEEVYSINYFNEIVEQIKNRTTKDRLEIEEQNKDLLNLQNGILNINTGQLFPHNPEYIFFTQLPLKHNPFAVCEKINNVFLDIVNKEDITLIQELFGFCLYRSYFIKKAFILTGVKHTGKTTIINILIKMLGGENICGVSLQDLSRYRFAIFNLHNKMANIVDDLSSNDIEDTGKFKMATGQSVLTGERKFGDSFLFTNYAKLIFACNKIPAVNDIDDDAYFDRWVIINFNKVITEAKKIPNLVEKIADEEEMSGLLNWSLDGLRRLLKQNKFSYENTAEQIKQEMLQNSNPIASFVYNCLVEDFDEENYIGIRKDAMYNYYKDYCQYNNLGIDSDDYFYKNISKYAPFIRDHKQKVGSERINTYRNVKIITENINPIEHLPTDDLDALAIEGDTIGMAF
jgi:P4 family phage/plasmid primase-like protien